MIGAIKTPCEIIDCSVNSQFAKWIKALSFLIFSKSSKLIYPILSKYLIHVYSVYVIVILKN